MPATPSEVPTRGDQEHGLQAVGVISMNQALTD